ncbi:MAG: hypothetical protein IAF38_05900 [Bacteroidia bacterium]|nr:hypothetical protein [Bacteroidia bacterium]
MTLKEKNQILDLVKMCSSLNIKEIFIKQFGQNAGEFDSKIIYGAYTAQDLVNVTEKMLGNFNRELNSAAWSSLPTGILSGETHITLLDDFPWLYKRLEETNIDEYYCKELDWLVYYQRTFNFWHVSEREINLEKTLEAENNLKTKIALYDKAIGDLNSLKQESEKFKIFTDELIAEKTKGLNKINETIDKVSIASSEISNVLSEGRNKKDRLEEIIKHSEERSEGAKQRTEEERKKFEEFKKTLEQLQKALNEKIDALTGTQKNWDEKFLFISEKESFIKSKEIEINNLTGFAAGVSLFHTFQQRKNELDKQVASWFIGLIASAAITVLGVILIFYITPTEGDWSKFALNSLKSLPFFVLLYFSIRQYSKERAIQEEYAFKSAVALTLNAFADKISVEGTSGKDKIILSTVDRIYEVPNVMKEKSGNIFSFRTKPLNDVMKNLTEVIKEVNKK